MNEYISRREASLCVNAVITGSESKETIEALAAVLVQINHATPADVVPVVHGRWRFDHSDGDIKWYVCSKCGRCVYNTKYDFCPHCGAKMDESEENNNE